MATKKQIKKVVKQVRAEAAAKTVSIGKPIPQPPVTVLGVEFEQGNSLIYGKCIPKREAHARPYHFFKVDDTNYILWRVGADGYLDYYSARDPQFTIAYTILDLDTEVPVDDDAE